MFYLYFNVVIFYLVDMSRQDSSRDAFGSQPRGRDRRDSRLEAELLRSQKRGSEHNNQGEKGFNVDLNRVFGIQE